MTRPTITWLVLIAALLAASGCARVEKEKKTTGLEAATNAYGKALRWGYYDTAYGYLYPDLRKDTPPNLENVRVTSYDVVQPALIKDESQTRAEQMVQIEYVLRDEQVVRKLSDRQVWQYDPESKTWWLHSNFPDFKQAP